MVEVRRLRDGESGPAQNVLTALLSGISQVLSLCFAATFAFFGGILWLVSLLAMVAAGFAVFLAGFWTLVAGLGCLGSHDPVWVTRFWEGSLVTLGLFVAMVVLTLLRQKLLDLLTPTPPAPRLRLSLAGADAPFE